MHINAVEYLTEVEGLNLTEDELRQGIAYTFAGFMYTGGWDEAPEEDRQEYYDDADFVLYFISNRYDDYFMVFCLDCVTNAYIRSGKVETAQTALNEAAVTMEELSEKYSDYEHYPNLNGFYTATKSYFDFCQNLSGNFEKYITTMNDYKDEISGYLNDLDPVFKN